MNQTPVKQKLLIVDDESGIVDMMAVYFLGMGIVIPSWSISARSAQNSRCTQGINISRLSGGAAVNGTADEMVEKNGA